MKIFIVLIITFVSFNVSGQNGYVRLVDSDSIMFGFIRKYTPATGKYIGLELWRTKRDKSPLKILLNNVQEYAIKKDTFRILRNFKLYEDRDDYFDLIETKVISKGKVNLYIVDNYRNQTRQMMLAQPTLPNDPYTTARVIIDQSRGNLPYVYILENQSGFVKTLPTNKEKLRTALMDFFSERYLQKYGELKQEIKYKTIPALVKLYNSK
jgi:hypothetical protein